MNNFDRKRGEAELINTDKPCSRGHISPRYKKFGGCVECVKENNAKKLLKQDGKMHQSDREWRKNNRDYLNKLRVDYNARNPEKRMLNACKKSAKTKGIPFDLTVDEIEIPDICPVLGLPLIRAFGERTANSPSLDRIIPELGYVKGNVIVISWRANRIKADATVDELLKIANFYKGLTNG